MTSFTIFGTGNMGTAIGSVLTAGGASTKHIDTSTTEPEVTGDVVILAVPYAAIAAIVATHGAQLAGKVVVDITNPLDFTTFDSLVVAADSSATAELAAALPESHVLKAFNTNFAANLTAKTVGADSTTVLIAGDDADAKAKLASAVTAGGLNAVDVGTLSRARELEALGLLQVTLAVNDKISWSGGFALVHG